MKFNSKHHHFRKKDVKMTKIKIILFQERESGKLGHGQSVAGFERTEVLGSDTTWFRAPLHPAMEKR